MRPNYPEGFLQENLENCRNRTRCEGGCETHREGLWVVRVIDPSSDYDWGYFAYCPAAVEEDTVRRGLAVVYEGEEGFAPN